MTRRNLVFGVLAAPLTAIAAKTSVGGASTDERTIMFPAGAYRIAPGGGIHVVGDDVYIRGCVFDGCTVGTTRATTWPATESSAEPHDEQGRAVVRDN